MVSGDGAPWSVPATLYHGQVMLGLMVPRILCLYLDILPGPQNLHIVSGSRAGSLSQTIFERLEQRIPRVDGNKAIRVETGIDRACCWFI